MKNAIAKDVKSSKYHMRIVRSKKSYNRKIKHKRGC